MNEPQGYWSNIFRKRQSRRQVLKAAAKASMGLAGVSLLGCAAAPGATPTAKPVGVAPTPTKAPAATPTAGPVTGGTLKMGQSYMTALDVHAPIGGSSENWQLMQIYDKLLELDEKGKLIPFLVESWELPDKTTVVLKIRKGVKFHDGADLNAQAIMFSLDRKMNGAKPVLQNARLKAAVASMNAVDDYTVKIALKEPHAGFLLGFMNDPDTRPVSPEAVKKYNNNLQQIGAGTGPYRGVEWVMDDRIVLKKFEGYWRKGIPYLDGISTKIIPDPTAAMVMLNTGELQFYPELSPKDVATVRANKDLVAAIGSSTGYSGFFFNQKKPPFSIRALREAFAYCIDKGAIAKAVFFGIDAPTNGIFAPGHPFNDPSVKALPQDFTKAKQKLAEGGYPDGYEFDAEVSGQYPIRSDFAQAAMEMLKKVGIKMNLKTLEHGTLSDRSKRGDVQCWVTEFSGGIEPNDAMDNFWHSTKGTYGVSFLKGAPDGERMDALLEKGKATYDTEERYRIFSQAQKMINDEVYGGLWITYRSVRHVHRKELKNYRVTTQPNEVYLSDVWLAK
ncbi:MAG: hypothetical protein HYU86_10875 [Chloroflexi bacterium]|nr:hypothetical protein [Chloroflexota bacterium]